MRFIFTLVLGFYSMFAISQSVDLDKVTADDLKEQYHAKDSSSVAVILDKKGKTYFKYYYDAGFVSFTQIALQIKIYKKEGLSYANFEIPYYTGYKYLDNDYVTIKKAFTYNLIDGKIEKTKVTNESKFKDQVNENWCVKKLSFPNVKEGSIIEIQYELRTENLRELPDFQFQYNIPVNKAEYTTEIPEFYIYKGMLTGYVDVKKEEYLENTSLSYDNEYKHSMNMSYRQIRTVYKAQNIKALQNEQYVNNISNYFSKVKHELETIRMPEEAPKNIAKSWEDIAKSIYDEKTFGLELEKFNYFVNDLKVILKEGETDEQKMNKVFNYVKSRMNWDGYYGYYTRKGVELAYEEKIGNVAEINLILVSMLKLAGLKANPVVLSTRDNGLALFPNQSFLNYVIAQVKINDTSYLLDATDKLTSIEVLPIRTLNFKGRSIEKNGNSDEVDLMPKSNSKHIVNIIALITPEAKLSGKIREQYFDYNAFIFRGKYNGVAKESYLDMLEKKYQGIEVVDYDVQNSNELTKPILENYAFNSSNNVTLIGDKMYVDPLLFLSTTINPFKQETREYPVDFVYPHQEKYNISFTLPEGYAVESIPLPKAVAMPDNIGNFKYNISNTGNQIQLLFSLDINRAIMEPEYYAFLKNFYKEMISKQAEKVILKKS
jgi:hypothetical protein